MQDFIQEKLDGKIENFAIFDFKSLNGSDQFGCPGRENRIPWGYEVKLEK